MLTKEQLVKDLISIGLKNADVVNVKVSLRSVGKMENGATTLIEALREVVGVDGTIVAESFVQAHPPWGLKYWCNHVNDTSISYAGAFANEMIKHENCFRSKHPIQKFAIIGKLAFELSRSHGAESYAYDVLRVVAKYGGKNLKIGSDEKVPGVGTTHVAIGLSNIRQLRLPQGVRYIDEHENLRNFIINWSGGCRKAFYNLNKLYEETDGAILGRGFIGGAESKLTDMKKTLSAELSFLKVDPEKFLTCGDPYCATCMYTWENIGCSPTAACIFLILKRRYKLALKALKYSMLSRYPN